MSGRLSATVCIVTGAARGIGFAICERFALEGARLACLDISERRLEPAVASLKSGGFKTRGLWHRRRPTAAGRSWRRELQAAHAGTAALLAQRRRTLRGWSMYFSRWQRAQHPSRAVFDVVETALHNPQKANGPSADLSGSGHMRTIGNYRS
jgi:hypothetical protein